MKHYKARGLYEDVWRLGNTTIQRREECCNKGSWKKNAHSWDTPPPPPFLPHQSKQQVARSSVPHSSRPACAVPDCRSVAGHWPLAMTARVATALSPQILFPSSCSRLPPSRHIQGQAETAWWCYFKKTKCKSTANEAAALPVCIHVSYCSTSSLYPRIF